MGYIAGMSSTTTSLYSCIGENVTFECTSNTSTLGWTLTTYNTSIDLNRTDFFSQNMDNYTSQIILRKGDPMSVIGELSLERISVVPLKVKLSVNPVVSLLNGAIIECSSGSGQPFSQRFTIYAIGKMQLLQACIARQLN